MFKGSWKTTAAGILLALGLMFGEIGKMLDDDPRTNLDWTSVAGAATAIMGALGLGKYSRQVNISTEQQRKADAA